MKTVAELERRQREIRTAVSRLHRLPWNANHHTLGYDFCIRVLGPQHVVGFLFSRRVADAQNPA